MRNDHVSRQAAHGRVVCRALNVIQPQLIPIQGCGEIAAAQADVGGLDRQLFRELMLQGHVELLRMSGIPLLVAVVLVAGPSEQHLLEAGIASRIVFDARGKRVAKVGDERDVVVDAGRDVVRSLVHRIARRPIRKSRC